MPSRPTGLIKFPRDPDFRAMVRLQSAGTSKMLRRALTVLFAVLALAPAVAYAQAKLVAPRQIDAPTVPYPAGAKGDADVIVQITVARDGTVEGVKVLEGDEPFAASAVTAAWSFRFEPATSDGKPVRATIRAKISFHAPVTTAVPSPTPTVVPQPTAPKPPPPTDLIVEGERKELATTTIGGAEVKILPGAFGDPFRAIEALPGVTPLISGLPFFYVRGAPPGNTGYFIDGVKVPMLFHLGAGPSVLAPGIIDRVDFHPGGYPARYGRFTGGVVAGETLGPAKRTRGEWNVRLFDASAMLETPVGGKTDVLAAGRYGYPGLLLSLVAPDTSLQYWDYQLRAGYRLSENDRISAFFFGAYDKLTARDEKTGRQNTLFDAQFHRADLRWDRTFKGGGLRVATTLMMDQSGIGEDDLEGDRFAVRMLGWGLRGELQKRFDPVVLFRAGADVWFEKYQLLRRDTGNDIDEGGRLFPSRADVMTGMRADFVIKPADRVEFVPGVRFDVYSQGTTIVPAIDPRLAARLQLAKHVWTITSLGVTHQTPSFLIPFPGLRIATLNRGLQEAFQTAQGVEVELPWKTRVTATVFHNAFRKLSDGLAVCANEQEGNECEDFDVRVPGRSYGLELLVKRDLSQRVGGWLAYTLSRSERTFGRRTILSDFDRTHILSAATSVNLGQGYRFGARFSYLTGRPANQEYGTNFRETPEGFRYPTGFERRRVRLPDFHRLDVRLEKRWTWEARSIAVVLEWFNVYLQKEAVDWNCNDGPTCTPEEVGPITIPSLGVEGSF